MAQQTAVKWLIEQLSEKQPNGFYVIDTLEDVKRVFKQAKEMEKEQIEDAYSNGSNDRLKNRINEQYYKETYDK